MLRVIVVAGATALTAAAVYVAMSADTAGSCYIDPAFGSCAQTAAAPGS